jgi:membrane protein DedA with SNARE-associated domain
MTELLTMMAAPAWAYLALFGFLAVDAMFPVVPIQAIMITSGALTIYGNLNLALVILIGALGMFAGDLVAVMLGRSSAGHAGGGWINGRLSALRARFAPKDDKPRTESRTRRAAERATRGLRQPGPLVLLLCRFVPGGRMAAGFHAGRTGYPIKKFFLYDGLAALAWASYGGLVGHIGGTAVTQSAWRLFVIAATAAVVFGTAGWILAIFGGQKQKSGLQVAAEADEAVGSGVKAVENGLKATAEKIEDEVRGALAAGASDFTEARAASADAPLPRSTPTMTGR